MSNILTIGITGHRNFTAEQEDDLKPVIKAAIDNIIAYHSKINNGAAYTAEFVSGMAEGADTVFAAIAIKRSNSKLRVIPPFKIADYRKTLHTAAVDEFDRILNHKNVLLEDAPGMNSANTEQQYLDAGKKLVDLSDYLIAVWDQNPARGKGGTADIVAYATDKHIGVLLINPEELPLKIKVHCLPEFKHIPHRRKPPLYKKEAEKNIDSFFDRQAVYNKRWYEFLWNTCFNLGSAAAVILALKMAVAHAYPTFVTPGGCKIFEPALFTICELTLVLSILGIVLIEKHSKGYFPGFLANRYKAEMLRLHILFENCGYKLPDPAKKTAHAPIHKIVEETKTEAVFTEIKNLSHLTYENFAAKRRAVQALLQSQYNYHHKRAGKMKAISAKTNRLILSRFIIFIVILLSEIIWEGAEHRHWLPHMCEPLHHYIGSSLLFAALLLPAIIARHEGKKFIFEWERIEFQSETMAKEIDDQLAHFKNKQSIVTDYELEEVLNKVNDNMHNENLNWEMFMYYKREFLS